MSQDTPSAAAMQAQQKTLESALTLAIQRMELRKWAVEEAIGITRDAGLQKSIRETAQEIYDFVTKPALELVQKEPQP